jgi:hypothetical protein
VAEGQLSASKNIDAKYSPYNQSAMRIKMLQSVLPSLMCAALVAGAQDLPPVMQEALRENSPLYENLRVLTDEIGGRVPGTPAFGKAKEWGVAAFKAAGADSVHTEEFTIAQSWAEGATEVKVVAPVQFTVLAHSIAWTPALPPTAARVVDVGIGTAEEFQKAGDISGAIVLVHSVVLKTWEDLFDEYFRAPGVLQRAVKGRAWRWHSSRAGTTTSSTGISIR